MQNIKFKTFLMVAAIAATTIGCSKQEPYPDLLQKNTKAAIANTAYTSVQIADWMSFVSDATPLNQLSIPGTHDSGALHEPTAGTAKTQQLSITDQLNNGVRFLDIRCRHYNDSFVIHHGAIYQNLNFDDVINMCKTFLQAHPNETIVMSVKKEHTEEGNSQSFTEEFNEYVQKDPSLWHLGTGIPVLGDVRGKIVLLRRFADANIGMDASHDWRDKASFTIDNGSYKIRVQDEYVVDDNNKKFNAVSTLLNEAFVADQNNTLYLNFSSGYKNILWVIPNITAVSNGVNPKIADFFSTAPQGHYGIIPMDFVTGDLAKPIVQTNF